MTGDRNKAKVAEHHQQRLKKENSAKISYKELRRMSCPEADKEPWIHAFNIKHQQDTMTDTAEHKTYNTQNTFNNLTNYSSDL